MTFSPFKAGGYAYGEILTSAQMNQANADLPFALDGRAGGAYEPSNDLDIQTPAAKSVTLNACAAASAASGGGLLVAGANGLQVVGSTVCSNGLQVTGDATFSATVTALTLAVTGNTTLGDVVNVDTVTINAKTTANGRVRAPKGFGPGGLGGGLTSYSIGTYDIVYASPSDVVTAGTKWRIVAVSPISGLLSGEEISFRHLGTGASVEIQGPSGVVLATIGPNTSGNLIQVDVAYDNSSSSFVVVGQVYR